MSTVTIVRIEADVIRRLMATSTAKILQMPGRSE